MGFGRGEEGGGWCRPHVSGINVCPREWCSNAIGVELFVRVVGSGASDRQQLAQAGPLGGCSVCSWNLISADLRSRVRAKAASTGRRVNGIFPCLWCRRSPLSGRRGSACSVGRKLYMLPQLPPLSPHISAVSTGTAPLPSFHPAAKQARLGDIFSGSPPPPPFLPNFSPFPDSHTRRHS
jgi:hypothetical protein